MKEELKNFISGKKIFITGHTGFKGSWLSLLLKEMGGIITGYSKDIQTSKDNFVVTELSNKITDLRGDINDYSALVDCLKISQPEILFHLAAQPLVRYSYENPQETYMTNVMGTLHVLEAVRECKSVKALVIITTDKCYENKEWHWGYRETDTLGGYDPYSSSKACAEILVSSYRNTFFNIDKLSIHDTAIATVRAGNVIGGGDWSKDRIIPDCIRYLEKNKPVIVRNPLALRPWQHVIEPIFGYVMLAKALYENPQKFSTPFNFGPETESIVPVSDVIDIVIQCYGKGSWEQSASQHAPHEANLLKLNIDKAKTELNWKPVWNINTAIEKTVDWYKKCGQENMYDLCMKQINEYLTYIK